jgi:hypothetical protein
VVFIKTSKMKPLLTSVIFFFSLVFTNISSAQNNISPVTITLPTNLPANTADWATSLPPVMIMASVKPDSSRSVPGFVRDATVLVTIKNGGSKVCGSFTSTNAPAAGINSLVKLYRGADVVKLLGQNCTLKPGTYTLCVQFFYNTKAISEEICKQFTVKGTEKESYSPPQNILPAADKKFTEQEAKGVFNFRWTPVVPKPKENVTYRLKVWQLMQGQSSTQAMRSNQPIVTKDVDNITQTSITKLNSEPCMLPYLCSYVWNVEASKKNAMGDIEMLGSSEASSFSVKTNDAEPVKYSSPVNQLPANGKILTDKEAEQPVQFKWTPVVPKPKEDVTYILRVFEVSEALPKVGSQLPSNVSNVKRSDGASYKVVEVKNGTETTVQLSKKIKGLYWEVEAISAQKLQDEKQQNFGKSEVTSVFIKSQSFTVLSASPGTLGGEYPCNTQTTFGSSLICGQGCPSAYVNYSVYTSTNILVSSVNVAPGAAATFTTPNIAGDYNFVITAICGNDTCHKVAWILKIRCTPNTITNCCQESSWGTMLQYTNGGLSTEPLPPCGRNLGLLDCGSIKKLKVCYNCNADCKTTTAQIKYEIFKAGALQSTSIAASCSAANINIPNVSGSYSLVITAICGDSVCNTCTYYFQTACASGCDCKSVQCTKKLWYKDVSTGIIKEFACINQTPIVLNCDKNYQFFADTKCSPDTACKMIVKGEFRNAAGALVIQQTPFNSASSAFNIISSIPGNYTFIIKFYVNDVVCDSCFIPITVSCNPPVDCCKNGNWYNKTWFNGPSVSNGIGRPPVLLPATGTNMGTWPCSVPAYAFHCSFACANNCAGQINYSVYSIATGTLISTQTIPNATYASIPAITTNGNYLLVIAAICGKDTCSNKLQYPFEIKCTPPTNCCQNTTQKDPSVYDAAGTNLATFSCTQPKVYNINAANKNCDKELTIKASANCGSNPNCPAKIVYTLVNTVSSTTLTGMGVLTIPASLANGSYTLTVDYYCGTTICKSCKFEIKKDCQPEPNDCCKNSSWGDMKDYTNAAGPKLLPASGSNLGTVACGSTKNFKICYNCAQGCGTAQIKYDVYLAYSLVLVSSTTVASCNIANITMPATAGNYQIRIAAICNGKECNAMDYFINTECTPVDCCKGGSWTNKSLDWDIKIKLQEDLGTELTTNPAQKATPQKKKDQKTPVGAKIKPVDADGEQLNPLSGSIKVAKCGDTLKIAEGNEFTLNAAYTCNTALANCKGKVIAKVKDPNGITYGTWPLPHLFNFATPGMYTVTYYAYCGETICDSCTFYVNAEKDCCKESKWIKADYQIVNKKPNGDPDRGNGAFYTLPTTIAAIPTYKADLAVDVENLNYQCAATQGCNTGYIITRRNLTTGALVYPDETLPPGQVSTSIYTKPFPQIITVTPTCGGKPCGNAIIFKVECLNKDCCVSDTIVFSTGMSANGTVATGTETQWYAPYPLKILSPGTVPFFGTSGGSATILQNVVVIDTITSYTASRNITVSKNCTINFFGKLGISKWTDTTWATLFKSFKLHKGSAVGPVVWTHVSGTLGTVGTYVTNNFNGTISVTPGVYTFVFEYQKADSSQWQKNAMFVTGIIVGNILPTSKDCCPALNTGSTGYGNPTTSYGQTVNLNGLDLDMDTCSCNEGRWDYGFEINGAQSPWSDLAHSPPYTFTCNPSSYPLKLALVYVCNKNWNCTFNVKLIKKNLITNIETVVVSENDIISGPTSFFNHSALRTWLYSENNICQYTIIPYCNGKECGDRLVFNINGKVAQKPPKGIDNSLNREKNGKGKPASVVYGGTIDRQIVVQKDSADTKGENNNARKGWDGHIDASKITFPPNSFAIFCPTGTIGVEGKCVPLVTILGGNYAISDGILNGKKELMSSEEVNNAVGRYLQFGVKYQFKGSVIKNIDGVPNVVAVYYSETDKAIQTILIPLINEKGYLKMQDASTLITQVGDKQTISKGATVSFEKHVYVGHVTLLR